MTMKSCSRISGRQWRQHLSSCLYHPGMSLRLFRSRSLVLRLGRTVPLKPRHRLAHVRALRGVDGSTAVERRVRRVPHRPPSLRGGTMCSLAVTPSVDALKPDYLAWNIGGETLTATA